MDVCERYVYAHAVCICMFVGVSMSVLRFRFAFPFCVCADALPLPPPPPSLTPARPHALEMHTCSVCQPPAGVHVWFPVNQAVHYADSMAFHVTGGGNRFRCLLVFHYSSYPAAYLPPSAA